MFVELSFSLDAGVPVYPGSPREEIIPVGRMDQGAVCNKSIVKHYLHNGTHVDAPWHFFAKGTTIDQIPIENFVYERPLIVSKELKKGELFRLADLKIYGSKLSEADIIFFCTGFSKFAEDISIYGDDFPALAPETAEFIRTELLHVKAVAIDTLSIESATLGPKDNFRVHRALLDGQLFQTRPLLVYENVAIERILHKPVKRIYAFPLRFIGLDASPVNMVAEI